MSIVGKISLINYLSNQYLDNIRYLDLSFQNLEYIDSHILSLYTQIKKIDLSNNRLNDYDPNLVSLLNKNSKTLETIYIHSNFLHSTNFLQTLTNLKSVYLCNNDIPFVQLNGLTNLESLGLGNIKNKNVLHQLIASDCVSLKYLYCSSNEITEIPETISKMINLHTFLCGANKISHIPKEISYLTNLREIKLGCNHIEYMCPEFFTIRGITELNISNNRLTSLPCELTVLRQLRYFKYSGCPIEYVPPQVERFLNTIEENGNYQNIYQDRQNVHNSSIQKSIRNCIHYLMQKPPSLTLEEANLYILQSSHVSELAKKLIFNYIEDTQVHVTIGVTFAEVFRSVVSIISRHERGKEILGVLDMEMQDANCMCFTGRISRLVNTLNGFDDNIVVSISDAEEIGNVIAQMRTKHKIDSPLLLEEFKKAVEKELLMRGHTKENIDKWTQYIE